MSLILQNIASKPRKAKLDEEAADGPLPSRADEEVEPADEPNSKKSKRKKRGREQDSSKKQMEEEKEMKRLESSLFSTLYSPLEFGNETDGEEGENRDAPLFFMDKSTGDEMVVYEEDLHSRDGEEPAEERKPAWVDDEEERAEVDIVKVNRLRKLRREADERVISGAEYVSRLRAQHARLNPGTEWVHIDRGSARVSASDDESDDESGVTVARGYEDIEADDILRSNEELVVKGGTKLLPGLLEYSRLVDANAEEPSNGPVNSVQFHRNGQLLMTARLDRRLRFFQVDGKRNPKIQSIFVEDCPIRKASFLPDGSEVIIAGRRKFFYSFDLVKARVDKIGPLAGREERSLESFEVSPDSSTIAFISNEGYILLISSRTKELIGTLKMNGSARSLAFADGGQQLLSNGGDGHVYHWDLRTRKCFHKDVDEGCITGTALCASPDSTLFAAGSSSGIVNIYKDEEFLRGKRRPLKAIENLTTMVDRMKFNHDAQILAISSGMKKNGLKLTVEKRPREMMLRREFANAVGYLNQILPEESQLKFIHWDFHKFAKSKSANVLGVLGAVASEALDLTGFYYSGKPVTIKKRRSTQPSRISTGRDASLSDVRAGSGELARLASNSETLNSLAAPDRQKDPKEQQLGFGPRFQSGVLRTNCIDCLDRTNVAQYAYGLAALGRQLHAIGLTDVPKIDPDSSIAAALMDMYQSMGDALAQQYGGSAAHNTVFPERQGKWRATTQSREFLKSIKRYYSNAYTDGEKQDAINLFLGYFQPQEGKPALWELDSDYYLHVSGIGDELDPDTDKSLLFDTTPMGDPAVTISPVPACKQDFSHMKLTSFDKLIERTCSLIKNVRLCSESDMKASGGTGNPGMAPDAAEIQLKSPNWLFGQRKYEETVPSTKVTVDERTNGPPQDESCATGYGDLNWLSYAGVVSEEDILRRYLTMNSVDEPDNWYGGTLIYDQDESSEVYKHYAELCQGPVVDPFEHDPEKERHYADALSMGLDSADDAVVEAEMEAALREYNQIGADLGIVLTCKALAEDPSRLTGWIIGGRGGAGTEEVTFLDCSFM